MRPAELAMLTRCPWSLAIMAGRKALLVWVATHRAKQQLGNEVTDPGYTKSPQPKRLT